MTRRAARDPVPVGPATVDAPRIGPLTVPDGGVDLVEGGEHVGLGVTVVDLSGADGRGSALERSRLHRVTLAGATLAGARLADLELDDVDAANGDWSRAGLTRVRLTGCRLTGLDLHEARLRSVEFRRCLLDYATLVSVDAERVVFDECSLVGVDLAGARLRAVRLSSCRLDDADLTGCRCQGLDLRGTTIGTIKGIGGLRGATIDTVQLLGLAGQLAAAAGLSVDDSPEPARGQ